MHMAILALADDKMQRRASESMSTDRATFDMYSASEWPADSLGASNGISERADQEVIMITPPQCRMIWRQFQSDTGYIVQQVQWNALGSLGNALLALASRCCCRSQHFSRGIPLQQLMDTSLSLSGVSASQTPATVCIRTAIVSASLHHLWLGHAWACCLDTRLSLGVEICLHLLPDIHLLVAPSLRAM